ncbi:MAG: TatD family nuclease-associated radical SAM protein [Selenomonadaceae bacterium]|nr:TatD family nuclease-associated radical SAM protein [Selenomonadaceae bacterium]
MIVYAVHEGGKYLPVKESFKIKPEGKRGIYVNLTNRCNCSCVFCLRSKKDMDEDASLWIKEEPTVDEVKREIDSLPIDMVSELVFCGFGEPTIRQDDLVKLLKYVKREYKNIPTRLNTNGLGELYNKREIAREFEGVLDTVSISLNASNAKRYLELTRAKYGEQSFEAMLTFAEHAKKYVPNVVMTVVEKVEDEEEISKCRALCDSRGLKLRVRTYEDK